MQPERIKQCLGVGVVTDDPDADMTDGLQIMTFLLRSFARAAGQDGEEITLDAYLPSVRRWTEAIGNRFMIQFVTWPAIGALRLPNDHLAVFTVTTKNWKRGRPYVIQAADRIIAEYLDRSCHTPDQVIIQRVPYTRERRYFAYQVLIKETTPASSQ
jgi:hypothetical protein